MAIYVAAIPFDNVLAFGGGGTIEKTIGIITAGAVIGHILLVKRMAPPPRAWVMWAVLTGWMALTALWTIDAAGTIGALTQILSLFAFYSVLAFYPIRPGEFRTLMATIVLSGVGAAFYGFYLYAHADRFADRLTLTQGNYAIDPNHFAAGLLLPIALALATGLGARGWVLRLGAIAAMLAMSAGLLLTGSRGGLLSLLALLVYMAWRTRYRVRLFALGCAAMASSLAFPVVWTRFSDPTQAAGGGRLFIWEIGRRAFAQHWLLGSGVGSFPTAYDRVLLSLFQPIFQGWSRPSHNVLIGTAVELGIIGLPLLVLAWYQSWRDVQNLTTPGALVPARIAIEAAIVALAVASMFLDTLNFKYLWLAFACSALITNASLQQTLFSRGRRTMPAHAMRPLSDPIGS